MSAGNPSHAESSTNKGGISMSRTFLVRAIQELHKSGLNYQQIQREIELRYCICITKSYYEYAIAED